MDVYRHIVLYYILQVGFFFKQIEGLWQPCAEQVYQCQLSNSMCLLPLCVSFLVILVIFQTFSLLFVMVIYDQGSLTLLLQKLQLA